MIFGHPLVETRDARRPSIRPPTRHPVGQKWVVQNPSGKKKEQTRKPEQRIFQYLAVLFCFMYVWHTCTIAGLRQGLDMFGGHPPPLKHGLEPSVPSEACRESGVQQKWRWFGSAWVEQTTVFRW